jgi:cytosylglucuronate decarboxylase
MCGFARSKDSYRFPLSEFESILTQAGRIGVTVVRFTGGEPLLHRDLVALVHAGASVGMGMSVITNGYLLPKMIVALSEAGLAQVVVSVDGASAKSHDSYRHVRGLFNRCMAGLAQARELGMLTRVNTVVGPHNYREMHELQKKLTAFGVQQWELSGIKLGTKVSYSEPEHVRAVCEPIYQAESRDLLVPMGKRFYGDTVAEQDLYFQFGIPPRSSPPECQLVGDVIYLDAKAGLGFGCSMLPHRRSQESGGGVDMRRGGSWVLDVPEFHEHVAFFRKSGPTRCSGCSTAAAGYSDDVAKSGNAAPWHY